MDQRTWDRASDLFDRIIELAPEAREAFIDAQAPDLTTRRLIERLLAASERETGFMRTTPPPGPESAGLAPGTRVGAWAVERELGRGGMGEVYRVRRADGHYEQTAALKRIRSSRAEVWARFARERQTLARLEHAGIARLIDGGVGPDGRPYLVMQAFDGETLDSWVARAHPDTRRIVQVVRDVAEAVTYAHAQLVLHRDIKPNNILMTERGEPKLLDFGVASLVGETNDDLSAPATLAFAAPEQLAGEPVSAATDVFGLAATAHELLTGAPVRTTAAAVTPRLADLPADLVAILTRALAVAPAARYPSMEAFSKDLTRFLNGEAVAARNGGPAYQLRCWLRRHPGLAATVALLGISLSAGITATSVFALKAQAEAERAETLAAARLRALERVEREANVSAAYANALQRVFGTTGDRDQVDPARIRASLLATARQSLANLDNPRAHYSIFAIGRTFVFRNDYPSAIEVLAPYVGAGSGDPVLLNDARGLLARAYMELDRDDEAVPLLRAAMAAHAAGPEAGTANHAATASMLALITRAPGDIDQALAVIDQAITNERAGDGANLHYLFNQKGLLFNLRGAYPEAIAAIEAAIATEADQPIRQATNLDTAFLNLARLQLFTQGDAGAAQAAIDQALAIAEVKGPSATLGYSLEIQACLALTQSDPNAALNALRRAETLLSTYLGAQASVTQRVRMLQAIAHSQRGDLDAARIALNQAAPGSRSERLIAHLARGFTQAASGDLDSAHTTLAEAQSMLDRRQPKQILGAWLVGRFEDQLTARHAAQ